MLPASAALVASLALQAGVTRWEASLYGLSRYTSSLDVLAPAGDTSVELGPRIALSHQERSLTLDGAYFPRLVMVVGYPPPQVFHRLSLNLALRLTQTFRLTSFATGCYGTNDFRLHATTTCPVAGGTGTRWIGTTGTARAPGTEEPGTGPIEPVPRVGTAKYMSVQAGLGFDSTVSRRVQLSGGASYLAQGGADAPTRSVLPLQRGPRASLLLDWTPAPDEMLTTMLAAAYYSFLVQRSAPAPPVPTLDAWLLQLSEEWRHRVGAQGLLHLVLGIASIGDALGYTRFGVQRTSPVAEAAFQQGLGQPAVEIGLGARVSPFVDFTTGRAYDRGTGFASLGIPLARDLRLDAGFSVAVVLDGLQRGQVTGAGQVTIDWTAARWASLFFGLGGHWQQAGSRTLLASTFNRVSVFLGGRMWQQGQF